MSKTAWQFSRKIIRQIKLTVGAKLVLKVLAYRHQDAVIEDNYLAMSIREIAVETDMTPANAHRAVSELVDKGVIIVQNEHKRAKRSPRIYRFPADFDVPGIEP